MQYNQLLRPISAMLCLFAWCMRRRHRKIFRPTHPPEEQKIAPELREKMLLVDPNDLILREEVLESQPREIVISGRAAPHKTNGNGSNASGSSTRSGMSWRP